MIDSAELVRRIASLASGTEGFVENIPVVVVVVGDLSAFANERDRHLIYIDSAFAAMSFMLALETLGLSSCPINWHDFEDREREVARLLGLGRHERVIMLISLGWADPEGKVAYSQKTSLTRLRRYH